MDETVEHLILGRPHRLRADAPLICDETGALRADMSTLRQALGGVITLREPDHSDIAALKSQREQTKLRLQLIDD